MPFCADHKRDFKDWNHHVKMRHNGVEPEGTKSSSVSQSSETPKPTVAAEPEEPKGFNLRVKIQDHYALKMATSKLSNKRVSNTLVGVGAEVRKGETVTWIMSSSQSEALKEGTKEFTVLGYQIIRYDGAHGAWENRKEARPK